MPAANVDRWIEQAKIEAAHVGSEVVHSEHLLLGLMSAEGRAFLLLRSVGLQLAVLRKLATPTERKQNLLNVDVVFADDIPDVVLRAKGLAEPLQQEISDVHLLHVLVADDERCRSILQTLHVDMDMLTNSVLTAIQLFPLGLRPDTPQLPIIESSAPTEAEPETESSDVASARNEPEGILRWFAPDVVQVMRIAQLEAEKQNLPISAQNLLVGLERAKETEAAKAISTVDISCLKNIAREFDYREPPGEFGVDVFSPLVMRILFDAHNEVRESGKEQLTSVHLLLAIEDCLRSLYESTHGVYSREQHWSGKLSDMRRQLLQAFGLSSNVSPSRVPEQVNRVDFDLEVSLTVEFVDLLLSGLDEAMSLECHEMVLVHLLASLIRQHYFDDWLDKPSSPRVIDRGIEPKKIFLSTLPMHSSVALHIRAASHRAKQDGRMAVSVDDFVLSVLYSNDTDVMSFLNQSGLDIQSAVYGLLSRKKKIGVEEFESYNLDRLSASLERRRSNEPI